MHLEACCFDVNYHQRLSSVSFLQLARHMPSEMKIAVGVGDDFWSAGRNARGHWGKIRWGFEICRCESEVVDSGCGLDTPALAIRQGRRMQSLRAFRRARLTPKERLERV